MVPVTKGPLMSWFEGDAQDYSHEAVAELRCDNSGHIEGSLSHLRKIYNSLVSVFANDISQSKQLVRQAIGALPNLGKRDEVRSEQLGRVETTMRSRALADGVTYRARQGAAGILSLGSWPSNPGAELPKPITVCTEEYRRDEGEAQGPWLDEFRQAKSKEDRDKVSASA
ncbi:hypothetical protein FOZ60_015039 [Perkinsus olseni]|uniref:Uncharacterized protein n=1 Tax=Perkinsus olseni TaxID=32597 RepID=A0A7J6N6C4_PEROL|nr:hypothetical protein FOZ60_015039 [Perkinsus olseni]